MSRIRTGTGGLLGDHKDLPALRTEAVEDALYNLKDENTQLKKYLNSQDDKTKKLITKVQRLTEDLNKVQPTTKKTAPAIKGRDAVEALSMMEDLRNQMQIMTKNNNQLKNKVQFFKSLHEAEVRKRAPYDHIPPRINTNMSRKIAPQQKRRIVDKNNRQEEEVISEDYEETSEDILKLEELVNALRGKLNESERDVIVSKSEFQALQDQFTALQKRQDIDKLTLQKELVDKNQIISNYSKKLDKYDEAIENEAQALKKFEQLKKKCKELELELNSTNNEHRRNEELTEMLNDLKAEKAQLEKEYNTLLNNQFSKERELEYLEEMEALKKVNTSMESDIDSLMNDKTDLLKKYQELSDQLKKITEEKKVNDTRMFELQALLEDATNKIKQLTQDGDIDLNELEEALAIVRLRRQKGIPLDFLIHVDELAEDKKLLQDLRAQHAECVAELEKTHKLLMLQEHINKDYKAELDDMNRKFEAMKNEYELRLEEDSRLLDVRSNKIGHLEGQLKDILYSTVKLQGDIVEKEETDIIELEHGQNMFELHIDGLLISTEGLKALRMAGNEPFEEGAEKSFTTFVHFDFFEFQTEVTPLGSGIKPHYNHTSRYVVFVDDFFLQYLQSQAMTLNVCRSTGTDFYSFGTINVRFKEIIEMDQKTAWVQYYADIISSHDHKTIIGKIDYSVRMRIPMAQSIQAYKERVVALNLLSVGGQNKDEEIKRFTSRSTINELVVHVKQCRGLSPPMTSVPKVYVSFDIYQYENIVSPTIEGTTNPIFNFLKMFPVPMTSDLDRYLRTSSIFLMVLDDSTNDEGKRTEYIYGIAKIPLVRLVFNEGIAADFDLKDEYGFQRGTISVTLEWTKPYSLSVVPVIESKNLAQISSTKYENFLNTKTNPNDPNLKDTKPTKNDTKDPYYIPVGMIKGKHDVDENKEIGKERIASPKPNKIERIQKESAMEETSSLKESSSQPIKMKSRRLTKDTKHASKSLNLPNSSTDSRSVSERKKWRSEETFNSSQTRDISTSDAGSESSYTPKTSNKDRIPTTKILSDTGSESSYIPKTSKKDRIPTTKILSLISEADSANQSGTGKSDSINFDNETRSDSGTSKSSYPTTTSASQSALSHPKSIESMDSLSTVKQTDIFSKQPAPSRNLKASQLSLSESKITGSVTEEGTTNTGFFSRSSGDLSQNTHSDSAESVIRPPKALKVDTKNRGLSSSKFSSNASSSALPTSNDNRSSVEEFSGEDEITPKNKKSNVNQPNDSMSSEENPERYLSASDVYRSREQLLGNKISASDQGNSSDVDQGEGNFDENIRSRTNSQDSLPSSQSLSDQIRYSNDNSEDYASDRSSHTNLVGYDKKAIAEASSDYDYNHTSGVGEDEQSNSSNEEQVLGKGHTYAKSPLSKEITSFPSVYTSSFDTGLNEDTKQSAPSSEVDSNIFSINVDKLKLFFDSANVQRVFKNVTQIFVSYQFLNYPPEDLESLPLLIKKNKTLIFGFKKDFTFNRSTNKNECALLAQILNSTKPRDSIISFTIVSEPTDEANSGELNECVDLAVAELHLKDILMAYSENQVLEIPVWDLSGTVHVGDMTIVLEGCNVIREIGNQ